MLLCRPRFGEPLHSLPCALACVLLFALATVHTLPSAHLQARPLPARTCTWAPSFGPTALAFQIRRPAQTHTKPFPICLLSLSAARPLLLTLPPTSLPSFSRPYAPVFLTHPSPPLTRLPLPTPSLRRPPPDSEPVSPTPPNSLHPPSPSLHPHLSRPALPRPLCLLASLSPFRRHKMNGSSGGPLQGRRGQPASALTGSLCSTSASSSSPVVSPLHSHARPFHLPYPPPPVQVCLFPFP